MDFFQVYSVFSLRYFLANQKSDVCEKMFVRRLFRNIIVDIFENNENFGETQILSNYHDCLFMLECYIVNWFLFL